MGKRQATNQTAGMDGLAFMLIPDVCFFLKRACFASITLCGICNPVPDIVGFSIRHNFFYPLNPINLRCAEFAIPYQVS